MVQTFVKRPISPLVFEPLYTPPEEVLYPGSDEEATPDERENKRLRVESQGRQYLNGRPLFIQTAGLRGPFDKNWVNPWRSKKRKSGVDDIKRFPNARTEVVSAHYGKEAGESTAEKAGVTISGHGILENRSNQFKPLPTKTSGQENVANTRRSQTELDEAPSEHGSQTMADDGIIRTDKSGHQWLKTDTAFVQAPLNDETPSSTPTPIAKPRSKSHVISSREPQAAERAVTLPLSPKQQYRLSPNRKRLPRPNKEAHIQTVAPATTEPVPGVIELVNRVPSTVREISLTRADATTKTGDDEVKRLSHRASQLASRQALRQVDTEDGLRPVEKLSQGAAVRLPENNKRKITSRLTPYVSEIVSGNEAASSAALRAAKAPKPKPSPHAVPPSTYQPEFQYRYARKGISTSASPQGPSFFDAPEQPQMRSRTDSSSSSGSSAFAEALEAAQEKAASKSFVSSPSPSLAIKGPESKSVKTNRQALRRLTFTPSGGAKVASRPSSGSSAIEPGKTDIKHQNKPLSNNTPPSLLRTSTKSSVRSLTNGNQSRNSNVLPEAQTDPIARPLAQAPSGPSTDFLETDKQLPNVASFDEGDSYLDLSTQAAAWKAHRTFQADVVSALTPARPQKENSSPVKSTSRKARITPTATGRHHSKLANAQLAKPSGSDEEEPMSTQEMVDAYSPFVVTTIKKRPPTVQQQRVSVDLSPIQNKKAEPPPHAAPILLPDSPTTVAFHARSPGMSTSPSPTPSPSPEKSTPPMIPFTAINSKPPSSSRTSFSILPNGTLTETSLYQQDGQQQRQQEEDGMPDDDYDDISLPVDPFGFIAASRTADAGADDDAQRGRKEDGSGRWDLDAAIEDAGSFLGEWDVEVEARKEGVRGRKRESAGGGGGAISRGILKGRTST